jgi:hypothetical protein
MFISDEMAVELSDDELLNALVVQEPEAPHFCDACDKPLKAGDEIAHTHDMSRMWHRNCLRPATFKLKPVDPFDWCRKRPGETEIEARARMLRMVPASLKRNESEPCPAATFFGLGRQGES